MAGRPPEPEEEREPEPDDFDVRFRDIAANLGDLTVPPEGSVQAPTSADGPVQEADLSGPGPRDYALGPEVAADDDEEDPFVPPDPPALATSDPVTALAWAGVVVPILLVLFYLLIWRGMPLVVLGIAGATFVLSVGFLLWRMPAQRGDDDPDGGAVV